MKKAGMPNGSLPADRAWRQTQYDNYLVNEVLPFTLQHNSNPYLIAAGTSFGAYHCCQFRFPLPSAGQSGYSG